MGFPLIQSHILQTVRLGSIRCITCMYSRSHTGLNLKKCVKYRQTDFSYQVGGTTLLRTPMYKTVSACKYGSNYNSWMELSYEDLVALMESGDVQLIDVREHREIQEQGSIPGSLNIPLGELFDALEMPPHKFKALYGVDLPDYGDGNIIFTCYCGIRSLTALQLAHELGFEKARHYVGGFEEWKERHSKS